ncbi:MAG TPA: hypothetical protein H9865_01515 [Candidatus Fournierella pullicola]|uniref:Uncharacterized protein n=1 Tax=Candidatus Allofournierella pullicola TaxID=2838596 RepID=A0A9D2ACM3_9FIRM|nr:hypothetical protein [Candidatus Fournierella pullicola]
MPTRGTASARPQRNAAGHHHRHHGKGLCVEELQKEMPLFPVGPNAGGVLFYQRPEHKALKKRKDQSRQAEIQRRAKGRISGQPDPQDVEPRRAPDKAGEQQQGVPFYLHGKPPFVNAVHFGR